MACNCENVSFLPCSCHLPLRFTFSVLPCHPCFLLVYFHLPHRFVMLIVCLICYGNIHIIIIVDRKAGPKNQNNTQTYNDHLQVYLHDMARANCKQNNKKKDQHKTIIACLSVVLSFVWVPMVGDCVRVCLCVLSTLYIDI